MNTVPSTQHVAAQPVAEDDGPLSPWWLRAVAIVMVLVRVIQGRSVT